MDVKVDYFYGLEVAEVRVFKADVAKRKAAVSIMGNRWDSNKTAGLTGTGSLTLYKVTSRFTKLMLEYAKSGVDPYFTLQGVNDDPGSGRGKERVTIFDVNIDSVTVSQLDVDKESLEEEIPFTFEGMNLDEALKNL